ncbi:hypothetical protein EPO56_03090 [Patescibacteria group bacterium]|nr:MAG: hypothetical protein EPO56_03090 [Patescibacteria group bacterium]
MRIIQDLGLKIKPVWIRLWDKLFIVGIIVLVGLSSFAIGRLSVVSISHDEFSVVYPSQSVKEEDFINAGSAGYVASKTGSTYFFPWCGTAMNIKPENKLYFLTKELAENAGYKAGNCNGLR